MLAAVAHTALAIFYAYTAFALISYMFEDAWVTKDELFAVGACFTVLVFAFAYLYLGIQEVYPHSFTSVDGPGKRTFLELVRGALGCRFHPSSRTLGDDHRAARRRVVRGHGDQPTRRPHSVAQPLKPDAYLGSR